MLNGEIAQQPNRAAPQAEPTAPTRRDAVALHKVKPPTIPEQSGPPSRQSGSAAAIHPSLKRAATTE